MAVGLVKMINRNLDELIDILQEVAEGVDFPETERANAVKQLIKHRPEVGFAILNDFIDMKMIWAIKVGIDIVKHSRQAINDHTKKEVADAIFEDCDRQADIEDI